MQTAVLQLAESLKHQGGKISGVAYDTAWTARIADRSGKLVFPECVEWLLENQHLDGSWGSQVLNYHDRVISTLSAVMALAEIDKNRYRGHIQRGEAYIWENIKNLQLDEHRLIGSELLLPSLMEQADLMGLDVPHHMKVYQKEKDAKLEKIDESMWYSPLTTLSFSLEFLGDNVDSERLQYAQLPNGSVTNSPAATAFFFRHRKDTKAIRYLKNILSLTGDGSVMTVYPIDVFELGWTMYNLMLAGLYFERYTEICDFLWSHMKSSGVGHSTEWPVCDGDDTAIICKILHDMQYPVDVGVLDEYAMGDYYLTYNFELDPSVSTNIHVLDFVKSCLEFPDREEVMERLARFLRGKMSPQGFWMDKWHASPYYPTSHAVLALCDVEPSLAERAVAWIMNTQNENGLWGKNDGTLEETAYAVQALMYYHQHAERINIERVSKAISTLNIKVTSLLSAVQNDLWVGKALYNPVRVVWSSIASAQFMARAANFKMLIPDFCWR